VLGLAVFEGYSAVIEYSVSRSSCSSNHEKTPNKKSHEDPYAQATLPTHVLAGAFGGGAHGLLLYVWDKVAAGAAAGPESKPSSPNIYRFLLHHGTAHAVLFGTFEGCKRAMLTVIKEDETKPELSSVEYLGGVAIAGGIAGQVQQWISQYTEQVLVYRQQLSFKKLSFRPTFRSALAVFLPSSIAFVAFEYGRYE